MDKYNSTLIILIVVVVVAGIGVVLYMNQPSEPSLVVPKETNSEETKLEDLDKEPEVVASEIDTSDWQTYRNEELGFEFRYPNEWKVAKSNSKIVVNSDHYKMGLSVNIEKTEQTLDQFIEDYNNLDPTSRILEQSEIIISDSTLATKLLGSTSMGIEDTYIYIGSYKFKYLIKYNEFAEIHNKIISSLRILN